MNLQRRTMLAALAAGAACSGRAATLPQALAVPGGVALVELGASAARPTATFGGKAVMVLPQPQHEGAWVAVVGIGLAADVKQPQTLAVRSADGRTHDVAFSLQAKAYAEQRLTVAPKHVELSPKDLARHERERVHLAEVLRRFSTAREPATLRLLAPTSGPRSSSFGLRRVFNGQSRNPHSGMDVAAPTGTPVLSAAAGEVLDTGDYFFNGNTVIVDHGLGFLTLYCHLSAIDTTRGAVLDCRRADRQGRRHRPRHRRAPALQRLPERDAGGPGAVPAASVVSAAGSRTRRRTGPAP